MSHSKSQKRCLVTGSAGFIGSSVTDVLLAAGHNVTGIDNFDPFYDEAIKRANMEGHREDPSFTFIRADIRDADGLQKILNGLPIKPSEAGGFDVIIHIAAKAGVRPSIEDPIAYQEVNVR